MQKIIKLSSRQIYTLNSRYLDNGWCIVKIKELKGDNIIFVIEKHTRKEKLEKLDNIT